MDFNLLAVSIETFSGFGEPFSLNWIGRIIQWLIESCNSIGLGIILFTLALKLLTLPLDIISRTSMKKNNLKMEKMRPQLEKLQRQYANNKELYNRKIQALYKKEGYSMFASCLPTLVTLIIFIVVINQFSTYSNYTNLQLFNEMSRSYTAAIENYDSNYVLSDEDGNKVLNESYIFANTDEFSAYRSIVTVNSKTNEYTLEYKATDINAFSKKVEELNSQGWNDVLVGEDTAKCHILKSGETYSFNAGMYLAGVSQDEMNIDATNKVMNKLMKDYATATVKESARQASKQVYLDNAPSFLWIKNLWLPDLPYKHPVNASISNYDFNAKLVEHKDDDAQFNEITYYLSEQKSAPNGFFILVVLSIGTMLLQQIIMNKSQKAQMELQTVDGQGAAQSKMMMWLMPIMFGIFSFMYSASFSLYMTVSTVFSMLSTLIINFFVERAFKKKYGA